MTARFPFSAVVGYDDVKLALLLAAVDPAIGGVLLRGDKGTAKTTLARGLAELLPNDAPFANLPLGATEDRLIGSLDLRAALSGEGARFQPGVLAAAHGGVLYVDEVNLLADHLVDALLDVAASGVNRVEREGIAHEHPARFVLVGSMNPEEGELRPQLLDRFGLCVDVVTTLDPAERVEAVRRRMSFDVAPEAFVTAHDQQVLRRRLTKVRPATVPDGVLAMIARLCVSVGAQGLRADLVTARAAAALAGWEGRAEATEEDVVRVAPFALVHRRRRNPFDPAGMPPDELRAALEDARSDAPGDERTTKAGDDAAPPERFEARRREGEGAGRRSAVLGSRGRLVSDRPMTASTGPVAVAASVAATATARSFDPDAAPVLREARRETRAGNLVVLAVDVSGSMGATRRIDAASGACLGLLTDAYQRRDRVAVVTFRGEGAETLLRPTGSVEVARARLANVTTGGRTPLAAGIDAGLALAASAGDQEPLLVLVSDGRATAGPDGVDPVDAAMAAADRVRRAGVAAVVVDAEDGPTRLGLAATLAVAMGARHVPLAAFDASTLR